MFPTNIYNRLKDKCVRHKNIILYVVLVLAIICGLVIRILGIDHISGDMDAYITAWMQYIKENGHFLALKNSFSDYNMPYLYIMCILSYLNVPTVISIKIVSIIFDYLMAIVAASIIYDITKSKTKAVIAFIFVSLTPTVIVNSSVWGQCDSIYTTFALLSIKNLLNKKYRKSFLWLGTSLAFKLQAIFLLPAYFLIWAFGNKKEFKWYNVFYLIIPELILGIPAILVGKPIIETYTVYLNQASEFNNFLTMNFFNFYTLIDTGNEYYVNATNSALFNNLGIFILAIVYVGLFVFGIISSKKNKYTIKNEDILLVLALSVIFSTFFLPHMHDRYNYIAEILFVMCWSIKMKNFIWVFGTQALGTITYSWILFKLNAPAICLKLVAGFSAILIIGLIIKITCNLKIENKEEKLNVS